MKPLSIAFTGTREGMSDYQKAAFRMHMTQIMWANKDRFIDFHHGGCIGADEDAHTILLEIRQHEGLEMVGIEVHPAKVPKRLQAQLHTGVCVLHKPKPPLKRNMDMVKECDVLIACPKEDHEVQRSGTWTTVRYAKKYNKEVIVIGP